MKAKAATIIVDESEVAVIVTKELIAAIVDTFTEIGYSKDEIVEKLEFPRSTFYDVINPDKKVNGSALKFFVCAYNYIIANYSCDYLFNSSSDTFTPIKGKSNQQFYNGVYYGFFKKSDNSNLMHFALIISGITAEMWTSEKVVRGKITYDEESYSMVLKDTRNKKNIEFIIGRKCPSQRKKFFVNTWRTDDCNVHSALCLILYIDNPLYETIDEIRIGRKLLREDIMMKTPEWVEPLFNDQKHKFIRKELSDYENEEY